MPRDNGWNNTHSIFEVFCVLLPKWLPTLRSFPELFLARRSSRLAQELDETHRFFDPPHIWSGLHGRCCRLRAIFRKYIGDENLNLVAMNFPPARRSADLRNNSKKRVDFPTKRCNFHVFGLPNSAEALISRG